MAIVQEPNGDVQICMDVAELNKLVEQEVQPLPENVEPSDLQDKVSDFDEDKRCPQYIPKKGAFYQHDDRVVGDEDSSEVPEEKTEHDKGSCRPKKLWHEECVWEHDMYREEEQGPKSSEELVRIYGYNIRLELMPPRARRWRRYGCGPKKYERSWEDKEASTPGQGQDAVKEHVVVAEPGVEAWLRTADSTMRTSPTFTRSPLKIPPQCS
ncbi:hypothetical protein MRX96_005280 [Rhipicephalus microplus]